MTVAATSVATYRDLINSGHVSEQQYTLLRCMREGETYSRRDLSRLSGVEINAVCGRVDELLKAGALIEGAQRKDFTTGRPVVPVMLNTGEKQGGFSF